MSAHLATLSLVAALAALPATVSADDAAICDERVARWLDPASGETLDAAALFERLATANVVLLGEEHTKAEHHRWQTHVLAGLQALRPRMVVGFEMLPRAAQPLLDAWSTGELSEADFFERTDWRRVWGYDAGLYAPLFQFVRQNRLPTVAMNVDRSVIAAVGEKGFDALAVDAREGVSRPAPAPRAYRESLARLFAYKQALQAGGEPPPSPDAIAAETFEEVMDDESFGRFVEAQTTWDRAMAEALAAAHRREPGALVVGIVGRGHLEYGHGIPHQLADLGVEGVSVLIPLDASRPCEPPPAGFASAVFYVDPPRAAEAPSARPRLGVMIEPGEGGVRVLRVVDDSVAASSGIEADDVIESAAGFTTATPSALIEVITRQAPGTWLPLTVRRDGEQREIVARFPQAF